MVSTVELPLDSIEESNIRQRWDEDAIQGLAESIQAVGQLYPVRVRRQGERVPLVDGHRRAAAMRRLGHTSIVAIIDEQECDEARRVQEALIANAQREAIDPLSAARAIARLMRETGWKAAETASRLGFPASKVTLLLAYLKVPPELAERLSAAGIGPSVVYQLARIADPVEQARLCEQVLSGQLTRDATADQVRRTKSARSKKRPAARTTLQISGGRTLSISGPSLSLEGLIELLEECLAKARKGKSQHWELGTLARALKDQARSH